ncbi:MAG: dihydropteroate synthase [Bacteroidetes bacterium]|nr:MAG: dihydropteroate synthase [Bacteroidota bacterium]
MTKLNQISAKTTLNIRGSLVNIEKPVVMGIINLTPDSFYKNSRAESFKAIISQASLMLEEGATFLDLGAFSTRPGAQEVTEEEELERLLPAVKEIIKHFPQAHISVDTFRAAVAGKALDAGAAIINDITAGSDPAMFNLIKDWQVPYIIMHMRGPVTQMMKNLAYDNLLLEIQEYFQEKLFRLRKLGIKDIIIDPGLGFSKTLDQNYEILKNLAYFEALDATLLIGVSRKSMIYNLLETTPEEALNGTSIVNFAALEKGARILRVHDVKEAVETIKIYNKLIS